MPEAELTLPGDASSVPTARRFVDSLLSSWGHAELGWTAALCVSELAANCALHARTSFTVRVLLDAQATLRLEVSDGSKRVPALRAYGEDSTTGRGLRILDDVSQAWGVDVADSGKTVWVEIAPEVPEQRGTGDEAAEETDIDALMAAFGDDDQDDSVTVVRSWVGSALPAAA